MSQNKLELTWVGKYDEKPALEPRILLENPDYSYDLGEAETILPNGKVWKGNMLIHGDNLLALKALEQDYSGSIKCIYIDPPYNTGSAWEFYDDAKEHSLWLELMSERLSALRRLLSDDGCIFMHIDNSEQAYLKVISDEIFGRDNFITTFTIKVRHSERMLKGDKDIHDVVEYVHMYQKSNAFKIRKRIKEQGEDLYDGYEYYVEELSEGKELIIGNKLCKVFSEGEFRITRKNTSARGFKKMNIRGSLREGNSSGRFYVAHLENRIDIDGFNTLYRVPNMGDDWLGDRYFLSRENALKKNGHYFQGKPLTRSASKELPYPSFFDFQAEFNRVGYEGVVSFRNSKKPESLIKHLFDIAGVNQTHVVLDSFLGSGTTAAVAHKMGVKFIGVELGDHAYTHCYPRLKAVVCGEDAEGITETVGWKGGGGFKFYELAPSLLKEDKFGNLVINKEYNPDMLAAAMAKQEGFTYSPDADNYWKQGYSSETDFIYTTTQFMTAEGLAAIHETMGEDESLLICCTSFQKECRSAFPNITIKKIPQMLLGRCEFGKDDYSLNIIDMPQIEDYDEDFEDEDNVQEEQSDDMTLF